MFIFLISAGIKFINIIQRVYILEPTSVILFDIFHWMYNASFENAFALVAELSVQHPKYSSTLGFMLIILMVFQCLSGVMLSFSLPNIPLSTARSRITEDSNDMYTDDWFTLHERGVDLLFLTIFTHLLKKFYLLNTHENQDIAWKTGAILFLLLHVVIFFGLVLCCTHLSDITLTIAANILASLTFKTGKLYWIIFTDKTLNFDTIIRLMYLHYTLALLLLYLSISHGLETHSRWKNTHKIEGIGLQINYLHTVIFIEILYLLLTIYLYCFISFLLFDILEPLSYELFMWGDIGSAEDVRFLSTAPHWYFRSYMGWLVLCPHHYMGIIGLIGFMLGIYFQVELRLRIKKIILNIIIFSLTTEFSREHTVIFCIFFFSGIFTYSCLPYGRFFNRIGGCLLLMLSYFFVFSYIYSPLNTSKL